MTNLSKERLEEILAGTEGVTPGPWYQSGPPWFHDRGLVLAYTPDGNIAPTVADCEPNFAERDEWNESNPDRQLSLADVDAAHIKNCDPDTIRSMASELLRLREYYEARKDVQRTGLLYATSEQIARLERAEFAIARSACNGGSDG